MMSHMMIILKRQKLGLFHPFLFQEYFSVILYPIVRNLTSMRRKFMILLKASVLKQSYILRLKNAFRIVFLLKRVIPSIIKLRGRTIPLFFLIIIIIAFEEEGIMKR